MGKIVVAIHGGAGAFRKESRSADVASGMVIEHIVEAFFAAHTIGHQ